MSRPFPEAAILAAGFSSRMNGFKPLMHLGGRTLLEWCVSSFRAAGVEDIRVITGHRAPEVRAEASRLSVQTVHNPDYKRGMFSSVRTAAGTSETDFFLLPVDIPLVRPATIRMLLTADKAPACPCFEGERGHPVLLPARLVPELLDYSGEGGLRGFLAGRHVEEVPVWDRGVLMDADRPEDMVRLADKVRRLDTGERAEAMALARLNMPEKGLAHGAAVASAALRIAEALNRHGTELDMDLTHNAALLHDIGKGVPDHETAGAVLLDGLGLGGLSAAVAAHRDASPPDDGRITEKEIVCLADKLICGSSRVSVEERFAQKLALYAGDEAAYRAILGRRQNALAVQRLVEARTGRNIEDILEEMP